MSSSSALNLPGRVRVQADATGRPRMVNGLQIESVRESWLVEDRWWTGHPLRRRYWELVGANGRNLVVFHDLLAGIGGEVAAGGRGAAVGGREASVGDIPDGWFTQRA